MGLIDGELLINPTYSERARSRLDLVIAGSSDAIVMVEAGAQEVSEDEMLQALAAGHDAIKEIIATIDELAATVATPKITVAAPAVDEALRQETEAAVLAPLGDAMRIRGKLDSYARVDQVVDEFIASIPEGEADRRTGAKRVIKDLKEKVLRDEVLERGQRLDGRRFDEIRDIWSEVGILPRVHGSAVFTRGETQALVTATLGTADDQQKVEHVAGESYKRFLLHYNFPPFSVGEGEVPARPGTPRDRPRQSRRTQPESDGAGRGHLPLYAAGRFRHPRIERIVVDGNGLRGDVGADGCRRPAQGAGGRRGDGAHHGGRRQPLRRAVRHRRRRGPLRRHGLQVAGTTNGITALQMDIKMAGVPTAVMREALAQARTGRLEILEKMQATIAAPRDSVSTYAPRIVTITIPVDKIRDIIGPGGKTIRSIVDRTGVKIDVEDDGRVNIASTDTESAQKAIAIIEELTASPELNKTYLGKVQRITDFGAFVEILPGIDGLLHVSEIAHYRVSAVTDELQEGDQVLVKVINVDPSGKVRLSRKALLPVPDDAPTPHRDDNKPGASESGRGPGGGPPRHRSQSRNRSNREAVKR